MVFVGRAGASAWPNPIEQHLLGASLSPRTRKELVLLHPAPDEGESRRWLDPRQVDRAHHIRVDVHADLGRLARFLLGRSVGLVLSGGGVRGFCHIGVLRALLEHSVAIDVVCGTSAGALVGGEFAMGWDSDELERRNLELFAVPRRRLLDYTIPTTSIFGSVWLNRPSTLYSATGLSRTSVSRSFAPSPT